MQHTEDLYAVLGLDFHDRTEEEIKCVDETIEACREVMRNGAALDTLIALVRRGPLEIGDVPSKVGLDFLLEKGLSSQIVVNGQPDHFSANTFGFDVYCIQDMV